MCKALWGHARVTADEVKSTPQNREWRELLWYQNPSFSHLLSPSHHCSHSPKHPPSVTVHKNVLTSKSERKGRRFTGHCRLTHMRSCGTGRGGVCAVLEPAILPGDSMLYMLYVFIYIYFFYSKWPYLVSLLAHCKSKTRENILLCQRTVCNRPSRRHGEAVNESYRCDHEVQHHTYQEQTQVQWTLHSPHCNIWGCRFHCSGMVYWHLTT